MQSSSGLSAQLQGVKSNAIVWPLKYQPGATQNFISNEIIVRGTTAARIWAILSQPGKWKSLGPDTSFITACEEATTLSKGDTFSYRIGDLPQMTCEVREAVPPSARHEGRLAWIGRAERPESDLEVYHAWLVEGVGEGTRILTQQSQIGDTSAQLRTTKRHAVLLAQQEWLEALVEAAREVVV